MSRRTFEDLVTSVGYAPQIKEVGTYREFLRILSKLGYLNQYQANCTVESLPLGTTVDSYSDILRETFDWNASPERGDYWAGISILLQKIDAGANIEDIIKLKEKTMTTPETEVTVGTVVCLTQYSRKCYTVVTKIENDRSYPVCCSDNDNYRYRDMSSILNINEESFYGKAIPSAKTIVFKDCNSAYEKTYQCIDFAPDTIEKQAKHFVANLIEHKIQLERKAKEEADRKKELADLADSYRPQITVVDDSEEVSIEVPSSLGMQDKYTTIVGGMNDVINAINKTTALGSQEELVEAFAKARESISKVSHINPDTTSGLITKYFGKSKWLSTKAKEAKRVLAENKSVKENIDTMFGLMHEKYNRLVEVSSNLQKSRSSLEAQIKALRSLEAESDENLSKYEEQVDIPTHELSLNTQIKGSIQKYIDRIAKVKGAITAMQATIVAFGRDLPAHKSDLEDEMALGSLLSNIDDYQKMFGEVKELVITVTDSTREKTYEVVDNLMKMQIEDTYTMEAIAKNVEAGKEFTTMLSNNSEKLAEKAVSDARFIKDVISGTPIEYARKHIKKLKG